MVDKKLSESKVTERLGITNVIRLEGHSKKCVDLWWYVLETSDGMSPFFGIVVRQGVVYTSVLL